MSLMLPSPHTIRSRILKAFYTVSECRATNAFTAHDPFEDTESPGAALGRVVILPFTAHDPFEDTERSAPLRFYHCGLDPSPHTIRSRILKD